MKLQEKMTLLINLLLTGDYSTVKDLINYITFELSTREDVCECLEESGRTLLLNRLRNLSALLTMDMYDITTEYARLILRKLP